jgi:sugar O-acyltransferase (sialic acid O-acetyltransferase NeuD family)
MRRRPLYVYGTGGHANSIASLAGELNLKVEGFISDSKAGSLKHGVTVLSLEDVFKNGKSINCVIGVGMNFLRDKISREINAIFGDQVVFMSLIHPSANVAKSTEIKNGVIVLPGAHIGPHSKIGDHCLIGANSSLDHDSTMYNYSSLAPGAMTGGNVAIGFRSALLINSAISNNTNIANDSILAGGSFCKNHIGELEIWGGVPAKFIKARKENDPYL